MSLWTLLQYPFSSSTISLWLPFLILLFSLVLFFPSQFAALDVFLLLFFYAFHVLFFTVGFAATRWAPPPVLIVRRIPLGSQQRLDSQFQSSLVSNSASFFSLLIFFLSFSLLLILPDPENVLAYLDFPSIFARDFSFLNFSTRQQHRTFFLLFSLLFFFIYIFLFYFHSPWFNCWMFLPSQTQIVCSS